MNGILLAIDETQIIMKKKKFSCLTLIDHIGKQSINEMLIFRPGCHIVNIYVNKPAAIHDSTVFEDSFFYRNLNGEIINSNYYILREGCYTLMPKCLIFKRSASFNGEDIHIKKHNYCQSSAQMIAERVIGLLNGRISYILKRLKI